MADSLNSFFDTLVAKGASISLVVIFVTGVIVWYRSGSTFLILRALLARVMGVKADANSPLGQFSNEHEQLLAFRIKTGMRSIRTTKHAQQVIKWAKDNDVNVEAVAACGTYFNYTKVQVNDNLPPRWLGPATVFMAAVFLGLAILVTPFIFVDAAIVQSNKTSHWFFLRKNEFNALGGKKTPISDCKDAANLPEKIDVPKDDVQTICKFATDPSYSAYVDNAIQDQHALFPLPVGLLVAMFSMFFRLGQQILKAFELSDHTKARLNTVPKKVRASRPRASSKPPTSARQTKQRTKKPAQTQ